MSSPNMNNFILMGAVLAFSSIIFGGTDNNLLDESAHLVMCKVNRRVYTIIIIIVIIII